MKQVSINNTARGKFKRDTSFSYNGLNLHKKKNIFFINSNYKNSIRLIFSIAVLLLFVLSGFGQTATKQLYLSDPSQALDRIDPVATTDGSTASTNVFSSAPAGVVTDAINTTTSLTSPVTIAHTTGTGLNRLMLVGISQKNKVPTSVTYGGILLTLVGENISNGNAKIHIYKLLNPPSGPANVVVTFDADPDKGAIVGVMTFSGVDLADALGTFVSASGNTTDPTVVVASSPGELVFDVVAKRNQTLTLGPGQTVKWGILSGSEINGYSSTEAGASTTTMSWTGASSDQAIGAVSIKPAATITNISFTQSPVLCSDLNIKAGTISVTNYISIVSGSMPANPNITAVLKYGATNIITLSNPIYNSGSGTLTWTGTVGADVNVPAGQAIVLTVTTAQAGVEFKMDYDSQSKPSKVEFLTSTYIDINSFEFYDAPYPGGNLITEGLPNGTVYIRATVSDPFGYEDITGLNMTITPVGSTVPAALVSNSACTKTFEYVWNTPATGGIYNIMATAKEGFENTVTDVQSTNFELCTDCPPIAVDDNAVITTIGPAVSVDVLANDYDPNNNLNVASLSVVTPPLHGTAVVVAGQIVYTPNGTFSGTDQFTYQICDNTSPTPLCDIATVKIISSVVKQLYLSDPSQALDRIDPVATADGTTASTLPLSSAPVGVAVDAVSSNSFIDGSAAPVASVGHTTGSGMNRLMLVGISHKNSVINSVTYGGTPLAFVGDNTSNGNAKMAIYSLVNAPPGTANVTVNFGLKIDKGAVIGVATFTGVNQTTPLGTFVSASGNTVNPTVVVSSAPGELVFDVVAKRNQTLTVGSGQTERWGVLSGSEINGYSSTEAGAATTTMSWTGSSSDQAIGAVSVKPAVTVTTASFTQTPVLCSNLNINSGTITVQNYISIVSGIMPANPNITAVLKYGATNIITLSNPTYSGGLLTWSGTLGSDVNVPAGQAIALQVITAQAGVSFKIDYDSQAKPSKIELPVSTYIDIISYDVYDAPYPGGSIITSAVPGDIVYLRAEVTDPFGFSDITGLEFNISGNPVAANSVATAVCTRTYEYVWNTTGGSGTMSIPATAKEGYENTVTDVQPLTLALCSPVIETPVFTLGANSTRCRGAESITYTAASADATDITYSLVPVAAGTINSATGEVTYNSAWIGTSVITATAEGCGGPLQADHTVTTNGTLTAPVFVLGATSTRCQVAETINYTATSDYTSGITYTLDAASLAGGNTITALTGAVTYAAGWFGASTITATAEGCGGPLTETHTVTTAGTITTPVFILGATSTRCQGTGSLTYTATSNHSTGISYSLDAASVSGGNTINTNSGEVTFDPAWTGTSVITATSVGCGGLKSDIHTVTITPVVGTPVFTLGDTSERCKAAETVTYSASATNTSGITYSLDEASIIAGNTINASTGEVSYVSGWSGISIITASATGCNGPATATHSATSFGVIANDDYGVGTQGNPLVISVFDNDECDIDPTSLTILSQPQSGNLQLGTNGEITYLPNGNFYGNDQFTYSVCANGSPGVCDIATAYINIEESFNDPCAEATKSKVFYLPFPEDQTYLREALWSAASVSSLSNNVRSVISIKAPYPGTVITYDHWEDGYETDITVPGQSTTVVWGDGNLNNGTAPGFANDIIPASGSILIDNQFAYNPRNPAEIMFDGKDKLFSTTDIAVSKISGDAGLSGATPIFAVQNVKTNVLDITRFGKYFVIPFGEDITLGTTGAFKYTGIFIRAATDGTIVNLDYNGDEVVDLNMILNEGEVWFYDGTASTPGIAGDINNANDIKAGATVTSTYPVGVDLIFGGIDSYGTRNLALLPGAFYGNTYYSPVHTTLGSAPVYVFFTNTLNVDITVKWTDKDAVTGNIVVPANSSNYFDIPLKATGYKFESVGGQAFSAVSIIDADAAGSSYDWSFNLITDTRLTTFAGIAWAPGSNDLSGNYNPVWVTPTANTTLYIKYDGDLTSKTATMSSCNIPYDIAVPVNALESYRIFDPDNDQTGLAVFTCDNTPIAAVWGQDPSAGNPTPPASPAQDVGYVMEPRCLQQILLANDDHEVTEPNTPIIVGVTLNDFGFLCSVNPESVQTPGLKPPAHGSIVVNTDGTITYTPDNGFQGIDSFEYRVCSIEYPDICDIALVEVFVTDCNARVTENLITGKVFIEQLVDDGIYTVGEQLAKGVGVDLYIDANCNGVLDVDEDITQSTVSDLSGNYEFSTTNGYNAKDDFDPNTGFNGNDGGVKWENPWVEQGDDLNAGSGDVRIITDGSSGGSGNAIRIGGPGNGISRSLVFNSATSATLKFNYRRQGLDNDGEQLLIQLNNITIYTVQDGDAVGTDINYTEVTIQLSSYNASGTNTIRFISNGTPATKDYFWIDNVELVYFRQPACYITKVNPSNTNGAYSAALLNQQTASFGTVGTCDNDNFLGVLVNLVAADDATNTAIDIPVVIDVISNDVIGEPDFTTISTAGMSNQPENGAVEVNPDGTLTYTPNPGFLGTDDFEYQVCSIDDPAVCDIALVTVTISCISVPNQNTITGIVFNDINSNGTLENGELGRSGIGVTLITDTNSNGVLDTGEPIITTKNTTGMGTYQFDVIPPTNVNTYLDQFNTNGSGTGTNGTSPWTPVWTEIGEANGFNTENVYVTGNQLRIQGTNTYYLDQFNTDGSGTGTNGTTTWSDAWTEIGESNGFGSAIVYVTGNRLAISGNSNTTEYGAYRTAPLSGAGAAQLSFKYTTSSLDNGDDWVEVQVASSTSGPWTTLKVIGGPSPNNSALSYLTIPQSLLSATTTVRFVSSANTTMTNSDIVYFDDVKITYLPSGSYIGAYRTANLSTAISANISFSYVESGLNLEANDYVDAQVATSTAGPWTLLKRFTGADGNQSGTFSSDITPYLSATTTIRFITSGAVEMTSSNIVNFDNVQISYNVPTSANYIVQLAQPIPSGYTLTTPVPSPTGIHTASFAASGAGVCELNFGLAGADLAVTKTDSPDPVVAGENLTYTIKVTNNGPAISYNVILTDAVPAALSSVTYTLDGGASAEWTGSLNLGDMSPAGVNSEHTVIVTGTVSLNTCAPISNTASVASSTTDPVSGNNSATAETDVLDQTNPTIICPADVTVSSDIGTCTASGVALGSPTTNDNCTVAGVTNDAVEPFALGTTTVTWTVTDGSGNTATCEQFVTVEDNENPVITCPSDQNADPTSNCEAALPAFAPTVSDNCTTQGNLILTQSPVAGTILGVGDHTITLTVTDEANNSSNCSFTFTVNDLTPGFTIEKADVTCFGGNTGWIKITATGGSGSYFYSIDNGVTYTPIDQAEPYTFSGLTAGDYQIRVKDSSGCETPACP